MVKNRVSGVMLASSAPKTDLLDVCNFFEFIYLQNHITNITSVRAKYITRQYSILPTIQWMFVVWNSCHQLRIRGVRGLKENSWVK